MKMLVVCCAASLSLEASAALGADIEAGRRLAEIRCAACHIVAPSPRDEVVADAPPFVVIGRKFGFNSDALVFALVGPHAKMNFGLSRPEANDVAAYIGTLAR
jgi:mono/diheme cytochrome c family protein